MADVYWQCHLTSKLHFANGRILHNHLNSTVSQQTENPDPFEGLSVAELKSYLIFRKKNTKTQGFLVWTNVS